MARPSPGMRGDEDRAVSGWVYIMTNKPNGILYVGVTSNLPARIWQHRTGAVEGFTKRYGLKRFVHAEPHDRLEDDIAREKQLKKWAGARKVRLIEASNSDWKDLFDQLA